MTTLYTYEKPAPTPRVRAFIRRLNRLADDAETLNLMLPNGAFVDCLLGSMANDLEQALEKEPAA